MRIPGFRRFILPCLLAVLACALPAAESVTARLEGLLRARRFAELPPLFSDSSYTGLTDFFREARDLRLVEEDGGGVTGYVKFSGHAEIVRLSYQVRRRRISNLEFTRVLHPLDYIRDFVLMADSRGRSMERGDARFRLGSGTALVARPFGRLLLFDGHGEFHVAPRDPEERLTLERLEGGPDWTEEFNALLLLSDSPLLPPEAAADAAPSLPHPGRPAVGPVHRDLLERFNRRFGIFIAPFGEYWYPRFSNRLSLAVFRTGRKESFYHYQYNPAFVPDTTLMEVSRHRYLLSYNRERGMKMSLGGGEPVSGMEMKLYLNPASRFLWANALLRYGRELELFPFALNPELRIHAVHTGAKRRVELFNPGGPVRYLRGAGMRNVVMQYSGRMPAEAGMGGEAGDDRLNDYHRDRDPYILWNRDVRFYPGPESHAFGAVTVEVSVPARYRCLLSGALVSESEAQGRRKLLFRTPATKGLGLVCGEFVPRVRVNAAVPVQVYAASDLVLPRTIDVNEVEPAMDFLVKAYGGLTVPVVNLVLRRWHRFGGISYQGLVVMNVPGPGENWRETTRRRILRNRPVIITRLYRDTLVHELAHQWWGGEISWNSYRDIWITEGLAQFSTLFYHRRHLSPRGFAAAVRRMKRWVIRHSAAGPPVYGLRIANLEDDLEAMQSVVYNRSALVFAMLTEMLGERELYSRLRGILSSWRYRNLTSSQFISQLSAGSMRLRRFFAGWVNSRGLPRIRVTTRAEGRRVQVDLHQDQEFVVPLTVRVTTAAGVVRHPLILESREMRQSWEESAAVRDVKVEAEFAPVLFE